VVFLQTKTVFLSAGSHQSNALSLNQTVKCGRYRPVPSGTAVIEHIDFNGAAHIPHDIVRCRNGTAAEIELVSIFIRKNGF